MTHRGTDNGTRRRMVGHDVRLAIRVAMFVWFVLLGASIAEWRELRDVRSAVGVQPSLLPSINDVASDQPVIHS